MKNIIYTGSAGFIGTQASKALFREGFHVHGIDDLSKSAEIREMPYLDHFRTFESTDLTEPMAQVHLLKKIVEYQPEFLIMGAAKIGGIGYFHKRAADIAVMNDAINANTLAAILKARDTYKIPVTPIYFSSSMVYESCTVYPVNELMDDDLPAPHTVYGNQKLNGEFYLKAYHQQHGLNYIIMRPFNCYGAGEFVKQADDGTYEYGYAHVIPDLIHKMLMAHRAGVSQVPLFGNGRQIRAYTHVSDIANALVTLVKHGKLNNAYNVSSDDIMPVSKLFYKLDTLMKVVSPDLPALYPFYEHDTYEGDVQERSTETGKMRGLGWEPVANIDLELTILIREAMEKYSL